MAMYTRQTYSCDNCGRILPTYKNKLDICTLKDKHNPLHVRVERHHGYNNDTEREDADLCQECAIQLLMDALERVKNGERATKGTESIYKEEWHKFPEPPHPVGEEEYQEGMEKMRERFGNFKPYD